MFYSTPTEKAQVKCIDLIVGDMSDELKKKMREKIPDDPTKTMGLYTVVAVAVGAKFDLTTNVNVADGLTNGSECTIKKNRLQSSKLYETKYNLGFLSRCAHWSKPPKRIHSLI